jgi:hypothetical protein
LLVKFLSIINLSVFDLIFSRISWILDIIILLSSFLCILWVSVVSSLPVKGTSIKSFSSLELILPPCKIFNLSAAKIEVDKPFAISDEIWNPPMLTMPAYTSLFL